MVSSAAAGTWFVDDDVCPAVGTGTHGEPLSRIQDAVDAAASGDEVRVAADACTGSHPVLAADAYTDTRLSTSTRTSR